MPFGAGARICVGATFAMVEATIVLAMLLRAFQLKLAPGQSIVPVGPLTLRPRDGMKMSVRSWSA